jgi:hypothetical protein
MVKWRQGLYKPANKGKYIGDPDRIVYRSKWELDFMRFLDHSKSVKKWASEEIAILYLSPADGNPHRYFPDFYAEMELQGHYKRFLIEIKPLADCFPPKALTQKALPKALRAAVNQAKWAAAREFCAKEGIEFKVLTERELFG